MNPTRPAQIRPEHLQRLAIVYIRQSSLRQVQENTGSTAHQREQKEYAVRWGWPPTAIEVIEDDLGMSGTSGEERKGWQALLKRVAQQQVGLILVSDSSRLTRSSADFETLLGLCQATETLLAVEGVIVDPSDSGNRLLARLRANVAQYENEARAEMCVRAKETKIRAGLAVSHCPTGYVMIRKGHWVKDPDGAVQAAIAEIFRLYALLGSMPKVLRACIAQGLRLPVRIGPNEVRWTPPYLARIHFFLTAPAYAGLYVYGRRRSVRGAPKKTRQFDWSECLTVENHHEGYISPATWRANIERLRRNWSGDGVPPGDGRGLCQGIITCGRCGRPMYTHYSRRVRTGGVYYSCDGDRTMYGGPRCGSVNGDRLDELVEAELLRSLAGPEVQAILGAADERNATYDAARRQRQGELDRAEAEIKLAKRLLRDVNPENRLLAVELEKDGELALQRLQEVKREQAERPLTPPLELTPERIAAIQSLAADLRGIWAAPTTTPSDRKALVRLFIREVQVVSNSKVGFEVEIRWIGGAATRHHIFRPRAGTVIARRLAAEGRSEIEIAEELNRLGVTTSPDRCPYTPKYVRRLIAGGGKTSHPPWGAYRQTLRSQLSQLFNAGWSDAAIAAEFIKRGLRSCHYDPAWTGPRIQRLRRTFGLRHPPDRRSLSRCSPPPGATPERPEGS